MLDRLLLLVLLVGGWHIMIDAVYSIILYLRANSYRPEEKQGWAKDHSIRLIRLFWGSVFFTLGIILLWS